MTQTDAGKLADELNKHTAMKFMGDCKCGKCQLVPHELIVRVVAALRAPPTGNAMREGAPPPEYGDLVAMLRHLASGGAGPVNEICTKAGDAIVAYRKTTGAALDKELAQRIEQREDVQPVAKINANQNRIMYVCSDCADNAPEGCGHFDRNELRVMADGRWLCEGCFDETSPAERGMIPDDADGEDVRGWFELSAPQEYAIQAVSPPLPDSAGAGGEAVQGGGLSSQEQT